MVQALPTQSAARESSNQHRICADARPARNPARRGFYPRRDIHHQVSDCINRRSRSNAPGHFRPIQRGFAMSDHPPEADIRTAGIYEYHALACVLIAEIRQACSRVAKHHDAGTGASGDQRLGARSYGDARRAAAPGAAFDQLGAADGRGRRRDARRLRGGNGTVEQSELTSRRCCSPRCAPTECIARRCGALGGRLDRCLALWFGWNNCRSCPVSWKELYKQYAKREVRLIVSSMCDVSRFKKVIPSMIDRYLPALRECELPRKHISNSWADMVMYAEMSPRSKRRLRGSHFVLSVEFLHVAEHSFL